MRIGWSRACRAMLAASAVTLPVVAAGAALAAATGGYASWSAGGGSGHFTAAMTPAAAGFPVGELSSDASRLTVPGGSSTFLGGDTPVGVVYGNSRDHGYLNIGTAAGNLTSTTTVTFAAPTPSSGWAFALGDIDADEVQISATGPGGRAVSASELGFQGTFNYCQSVPKPGACAGPGPFTDEPHWDAATATLRGNGADTTGAAGWFEPSTGLTSVTFRFSQIILGTPIYQLWLATLEVPVTGQVDGVAPGSPADGAQVDLDHPDGSAVLDPAGRPETAAVDDHGGFELSDVASGDYLLTLVPPAGFHGTGSPAAIVVDAASGRPALGVNVLAVHPTGTSAPPGTGHPSGSGSRLPSTGFDGMLVAAVGTALTVAGWLLMLAGSRRLRRYR
jgi:hypothetical protein